MSSVSVSEDAGFWILDNQTDLRRRTSPIQNPVSSIQHRLRTSSSFLPESTSNGAEQCVVAETTDFLYMAGEAVLTKGSRNGFLPQIGQV
jgi:hypothetical protein